MKLISWNCNGKFSESFKEIIKENADIYVIQECEDPLKSKVDGYEEFINNKEDILNELSELRKSENKRKIKEYEAKYNFNYNENAQDKEIIDKLLTGDVDMGANGKTG